MNKADVLSVLREWIKTNDTNRPPRGEKVRMDRELEDACAAVAEAFDTIAEGKRQWDQVAASLGVDGDDADAVIARATAVAELIAERDSLRAQLRTAVADYMRSEGCSCCQNIDAHDAHRAKLAQLLDVPPYDDGSGYDFSPYRTGGAE